MTDKPALTDTQYGFEWGPARVVRLFDGGKEGWVVLGIETPRHNGHNTVQVYVTKTGKVRVFDSRGEWRPDEPTISDPRISAVLRR